jgi:hypothetical protein
MQVSIGRRAVRRRASVPVRPMLSEYVRVVAPHLCDSLLSARARGRLHSVARQVPLSDLGGFECALGDAPPRADLIVRLPRVDFDLPAARTIDPVWRRIRTLSTRLRDRSALHFRSVNVMGLEFDIPSAPTSVAPPALFFELNGESDLRAPRLIALARELQGDPLAPACAALLRRCVEALPAASMPFQLGAMLSRPGEALRLVVSDVPPNRLVGYLRAIGWAGDDRTVADIVHAFSDRVESFAVSMDLARSVHPRIGVECYVRTGSRFIPGWRLLLERLEQFGLCTPAKAQALLAWSGVCQEATCPVVWPRHLRWGDRLLASSAISVIARTLGHVKVVLRPGSPIEAKAYLGFAHYWLDRRAKRESWIVTA